MNRAIAFAACCLAALFAAGAARGEDIVYYSPTETGNILDWLISVDHPIRYDFLGSSLQQDALETTGGEKNAAPQAGMKAGLGMAWEERHFESDSGLKGGITFRPHSLHFTYAFAYLVCDKPHENLLLCTGSDDALLVLLNGQEAQRVQAQRGYAVDQEKATISLRQGWNRLLCKVDDILGGHGLIVRLTNADGQPFTDFKICLVPPKDPQGTLNYVDGKMYEDEAARLLKEAIRLSTEGQLDAAIRKCRQVVERFSKANAAAEAIFQAARYEKQQRHDPAAVAAIDELLVRYPYSKWSEDALVLKAEWLYPAGNKPDDAAAALKQLIDDHPSSRLVPEATLKLALIRAAGKQFEESDALLQGVRTNFRNTVEAVQALEMLGDNQSARNDKEQARQLWRQTIDEAGALAGGKYVWFVNVQAMLQTIADRARAKMEGKWKPQ